ncbi:MAG: valine--tRNA ligase [Bacteroidia bacterium]|nr:valine--tRNA ligase [Bacteroidia bacterium]
MNISAKYSPGDIEDKWYSAWMEAKIFKSIPDDRQPYTIAIPPPNVTGILHMGHVLNNTLQDVLIRRKRMEGYNACWVPGTDHASIATEAKVVKLLADQGIAKTDMSREDFLKHAFAWKEKYGGIILQQLKKLGASCDWDRTAFTMDEEYSDSVIKVFCDLYEKGYVYRGIRMVNWDPSAQTAVSDEEVIYRDTPGKLYHVRYPIQGSEGEFVTIATTRPETILGDTAIAIHPEDTRYTHLHGKFALVPLINRLIPIITDTYVDREFGTGCLKVTPAHDINDYEIGIRHNLPVIDALNPNGTISPAGELYIGKDRFFVRKQIAKDLEERGLLAKTEEYRHSVGYSERTDAAIEPRLSMQWFLKMKEISQPAYKAVVEGELNLIPDKFVNTYKHWMENVRDWCLSRQLWWGHRIPAYYIKGSSQFVVATHESEALEKAKIKTGNAQLTLNDLQQDPDVLDTWASSWLWPISIFHGLTRPGNPEFNYYYPTNDLVTAPEILFFWVARMIIAGYEYTGKKPFTNVYLTGIVRDDKRRKMSKQLGNSPDPLDLIEQYGADGVRVGMLLSSPAGNDLLYKEALVEQGRNFANKIWNAYRLVNGWTTSPASPSAQDGVALHWMNARLNESAAEIRDHFSKFRISDALMSVYKLVWDDFCNWFLEMIKPPQGESVSAETLSKTVELFEKCLQLVHPFMPFLSEEIWQGLKTRKPGAFIAIERLFTEVAPDTGLLKNLELIRSTITEVRAYWNDQRSKQAADSEKQDLELYIKSENQAVFQKYLAILKKFLRTDTVVFVQEKPDGAGTLQIGTTEIYIPLPKLDVADEKTKILEDIDYFEGFLLKVNKNLQNERFVSNAPAQVIQNERQKQSDAEAKLKLLRERLAEMGS